MRVIEVTVSPGGDVTVQTKGFVGGDCLAASRFLELALGVAVGEHKTAELYQAEAVAQQAQQ